MHNTGQRTIDLHRRRRGITMHCGSPRGAFQYNQAHTLDGCCTWSDHGVRGRHQSVILAYQ